jgi:hypothetical protein
VWRYSSTGDALKLSASSLSARSPGAPGAKHGGPAALAGQVDAAGGGRGSVGAPHVRAA